MSIHPTRRLSRSAALTAAVVAALLLPGTVLGHAELDTSEPAADATVDGPFDGPIVLTFTEALVGESGAVLRDSAGIVPATDVVDGDTVTITPDAALGDGDYEVEWTAIADDGHIERGTVRFTVVAAATPSPSPTATATPSATPTSSASAAPSPSATPSPAATPVPSPTGTGDPAAGTGADVLLPIVIGALIVAGLAVLLLRRRDSSSTTP